MSSFLDELKERVKAVEEKAVEYGKHEIAVLVGELASVLRAALHGKEGVPEVAATPPVDLSQDE